MKLITHRIDSVLAYVNQTLHPCISTKLCVLADNRKAMAEFTLGVEGSTSIKQRNHNHILTHSLRVTHQGVVEDMKLLNALQCKRLPQDFLVIRFRIARKSRRKVSSVLVVGSATTLRFAQ